MLSVCECVRGSRKMTHSQLTKREYLNSRQEVREGGEEERELSAR